MTRGCFGALRLAAARLYLHFTTRVFGHSAISPFLGGPSKEATLSARHPLLHIAQRGSKAGAAALEPRTYEPLCLSACASRGAQHKRSGVSGEWSTCTHVVGTISTDSR